MEIIALNKSRRTSLWFLKRIWKGKFCNEIYRSFATGAYKLLRQTLRIKLRNSLKTVFYNNKTSNIRNQIK